MATTNVIGTERAQRAFASPIFLDFATLELSARLNTMPLHDALAAALAAAVDALADADPLDVVVSDAQFEQRLHTQPRLRLVVGA